MRASRLRPALALVLVATVVAACSSGTGASPTSAGSALPSSSTDASVLPIVINSQLVVGSNRFMFSFLDADEKLPAAEPDRPAAVAFVPPGSDVASDPTPATFVWAIEDVRGIYVLRTEFATAGEWTAVFVTNAPGEPEERLAMRFDVAADGSAVAVGEPAVASTNPVASDVSGDLDRISTDAVPEERFYTTTPAEALAAGEPFVLAFATPAFCQTAQCGPTMDAVKGVAADYPEITFIHVEPYQLQYTEGRLQPVLANGGLQPVDAVNAWGILTEPWVYVVNAEGVVTASYEGIFADQELRDALDALDS